MSNPTAIVAEDEGPQREELVRMLKELWPELTIAAQCESGAEALEAMRRLTPNVAFLDIQMPEVSGIDVARAATGRTNIVFVTAFDQFAVQAFEDGAIDYLLKPVGQSRFVQALERARKVIGSPIAAAEKLAQLQEVAAKSWVPDVARADLELLAAVGRLWDGEAIKRFHFGPAPERKESSIFASLLGGYGR